MKKTIRILVIEDTEDVRNNIIEILESEGYDALGAENGKIGIETAIQVSPDLILCDIMMPVMDGYNVLESLRKNVITSTTPFIFLTAKNTRDDLRRGMALGADDYIAKPFTIDELLNGVTMRLKRAEDFKIKSEQKLNELTRNMGVPITRVINEPIKAIIGFSKMVMTEYMHMEKPEIAEFMALIYNAGMKLNGVIHKTLLFYQLEALSYKAEEIKTLQEKVSSNSKSKTTEICASIATHFGRSNDLMLHIEANTNLAIPSEFLDEALTQLVENAFIYSPKRSKVKVVVGSDGTRTYFTISDEGLGMTESQIESSGAFTRFNEEFAAQEGIGLGLTIVRKINDLFGTQLSINST
ncbi:MAG: hypothetical protein CVU06_15145, partial [Bacteroidetes bacterium HGW-Bacteroidetes-22]